MGRVSSGTMTVAIVAILIGLGGAYIVRQQMHQPQVPPLPAAQPQNIIVPVALTDMEVGRTITLDDIAIRSFTPEEYEKSEFAQLAFMRNSQQIVGRVLRTPIPQGNSFLPNDLYPVGMGPDLAERLQAGYRAVTVPIENIGVVQGFARAGSFVDVLFRVDPSELTDHPEETLTLLERIEVLAIDTFTQPGQQVTLEQEGSVTLAVTPHQAKILKVVEERGSLSLTLRNPEDKFEFVPFDLGMGDGLSQANPEQSAVPVRHIADREEIRGVDTLSRAMASASERVTLEDLLGLPRKPRQMQMEVYKGGNREVFEFEEFNSQRTEILRQGGRIQTPIAGQPAATDEVTSTVSNRSRPSFRSDSAAQ